ncbi:cadherin-like protein 26 [Hyla sarda]|uniref:cadherin-like protein 26 n=1 Tax=Hyla sarda TaxID=327740 RepID=UPI0024C34789|nr:cadherin-like protein 26 [Hyla sarda]
MEAIAGKVLVVLLVVLSGVLQSESSSGTRGNIIANKMPAGSVTNLLGNISHCQHIAMLNVSSFYQRLQRRVAKSRQKRDWIIDTFTLQEELPGPYPKLIGTVKLEEGNELLYKLQGSGVDEDPKGLFHINEDTGSIYVHQKVDYEKYPIFQWKFNAINKTSMKVGTRLGIHLKIVDINDNAPEFKNKTYYVSVNESTLQGYTIFTLLAYDQDEESSKNSIVNYYLRSQMPIDPNVEFTINKDTGFISFKGCLNYEANRNYKLLIEAQDNGVETRQSSTCEVNVEVLDKNTQIPKLLQQDLRAEVPERDANVTILRIGINDGDTPYTPGWRAKFTIIEGNDDEHFLISTDPVTNEGLLNVTTALDYEESNLKNLVFTVENEEPIYTCKILQKPFKGLWVVESSKSETQKAKQKAGITVDVLDVNDAPVFKPQTILVTLEEQSIPPGTVLVTIQAKDPDIVAPNKIKYFLANDSANWLSLNEDTGVITTKGELDREHENVTNSKYLVKILAVDDGEPPMSGTATLLINLKDINDNVPKLLNPLIMTCDNEEEAFLSTPIIDKDLKPYSGPFYVHVADKEPEKKPIKLIDYDDDILKIKKEKGAPQGNHTIHLEIYDLQGVQSLENITVYVCDCLGGDVCAEKLADPPTLSGGAIALLLLAPVFFLLLCLLLCKVENKKVMVPVENEPLNSMITYNEESENKDCLATNVSNEVGNMTDTKTKDQEEIDSAFHRSSTRKYSTSAQARARVGRSNSVQVHTFRNQDGNRVGTGTFDRANRLRHSSFHSGRAHMSIQRANSLRIQTNGGHRSLAATHNSLQRKYSRTLETALIKKLHAEMNVQNLYKPRVYAEEGELSQASSLEAISISDSSVNLSGLQSFGSKFNILENICEDHMANLSTSVSPTDL